MIINFKKKDMKKVLFLLSSIIFFSSCSETEPVIYDPNNSQALVYFSRTNANLAIEINATGQLVLPINVSTLSTEDRTVTVEVDVDKSTADIQNYTVSSSVVIPAGEYFGNLVINGVDVTAETTPELLYLDIVSFSDETAVISPTTLEVSVFQFCPIAPGLFTGNYLIEELTPFVDGPTLNHNQVVTLVATSETGRRFATKNYPNYCSPTMNFNFSLVCGEVIVAANQRSVCNCTAAGLFFGPATTPSTYNVADDSVFEMTFTNDVTGDCGTATQTTYRFTKQ
jgi:hypothetical protein